MRSYRDVLCVQYQIDFNRQPPAAGIAKAYTLTCTFPSLSVPPSTLFQKLACPALLTRWGSGLWVNVQRPNVGGLPSAQQQGLAIRVPALEGGSRYVPLPRVSGPIPTGKRAACCETLGFVL